MATGWVKISRQFAADLPKGRPYTRLEAAYSIALDAYEKKTSTLRGYAALWGWNHHRVKRFLEEIDMLNSVIICNQISVPLTSQTRPTDVPLKHNNIINIETDISQQCPNDVPLTSRTIIEKKREEYTFIQFWSSYPRKTGKADASKAWLKLNPSPEIMTAILAALEWQCQQPDWQKDDGRFIPHPSTWLNGRRWEDEPAIAKPHSTTQTGGTLEELRAKGIDI